MNEEVASPRRGSRSMVGAFVTFGQGAARDAGVAGAVNLPCLPYGFSLSQKLKKLEFGPTRHSLTGKQAIKKAREEVASPHGRHYSTAFPRVPPLASIEIRPL